MARLDDLLPELKDDTSPQLQTKKNEYNLVTGKKRRAWLIDIPDQGTSINNKEPISQGTGVSLQPTRIEIPKGAMNQAYKPVSLCFADLRSNPLQLFRFLYELMLRENDNYQTPRVKLREMMLNIGVSKDSARTALRFLLKQKFIARIEFQPGHLGWSKYQLNENICNELKKAISIGSINPFDNVSNQVVGKADSAVGIDPWEEVDISPLESMGFNKNHLLQLKNKSTPDITQESINHFAYSLKYNKKTKEYPNPLATFITVLKRGEAWTEPKYQSPQELAQLQIIEAKKAELKRKKDIEEQLYKVAFEEWQQDLSKEDVETIAPDLRKKGDPVPPSAKLSLHFKETIWPDKRKDYLL